MNDDKIPTTSDERSDMPTTNWILEAAEDRYLEAIDPIRVVNRELELACPFCERVFVSGPGEVGSTALARHIARDHPLLRPVLMVGGRMLAPNSVLTQRISEADVVIENATVIEIGVNGAPRCAVSPDDAARIIADRPRQMLDVRLANERAQDATASEVDYRIKLDVADESELDRVDQAFIRHLARPDVQPEDVMRFSNDTDGVANFYRDGLASYVLGVFAKDDTAATKDPRILERAIASFGRAAFHLKDFGGRPVAAALSTCADLNLNVFKPAELPTGVLAVEAAVSFLCELAEGATPLWPARPADPPSEMRCPVDEATFSFLNLLFAVGEGDPRESAMPALELIEHGTLTPQIAASLQSFSGSGRTGEASRMSSVGAPRSCTTIQSSRGQSAGGQHDPGAPGWAIALSQRRRQDIRRS